ncbi:MAG: GNAT family N-acetyltransferase [Acidimicrobiales bacterium]|jgi:ribosomal protein S18 acetylase RimI-like enzyme
MTTIRVAATPDGDRLDEIDRLTRSSENSPSPIGQAPTSFFEHLAPADVLVATDHDSISGYIQFRQPTPLASNAHVWQINGVAVDPRYQRCGLGKALVEAAIREIGSRGGWRITLRVLSTNPGAQRLYARCGFVVEGVLRSEFVLDDREVDDVLMALVTRGRES